MDFSFTFKKKPEGGGPKKPEPDASQTQFDQLRGCGINLRGHATLKDLAAGTEAAAFEQAPYVHLLCLLGGTREDGEAWSDEVWLWPAACVAESGVLTACIGQVSRLCRGALPVEEVQDELGEAAAVGFVLDGEAVQWEIPVADGEPDGSLLSALAGIAAERGEGARLAVCPVEGVGLLLIFMTEAEMAELAETTGMGWTLVE